MKNLDFKMRERFQRREQDEDRQNERELKRLKKMKAANYAEDSDKELSCEGSTDYFRQQLKRFSPLKTKINDVVAIEHTYEVETPPTEKIKAFMPQIVVSKNVNKPYFSITYYDIEKKEWINCYGSYFLEYVVKWFYDYFEEVEIDMTELKPFVENAQFAIKATDSADNYSSGFRNGIRYCLALIEGKEPEYETLKGVKPIEKFPFHHCPSCNTVVSEHNKFCSECGQKLDWSDTE